MKKKMVAVLLLSSMVFAGCAKEEAPEVVEPTVEATDDSKEEAKPEEEKEEEALFDYDALGIKPVEYGDEFEMGENLKAGLTNLIYPDYEDGKWDNSKLADDQNWKDSFINSYLQNSWFSFDYMNYVGENSDGFMSKEQVEYAQYSLTGTYIEFDDGVDLSQASSGFGIGEIDSYTVDKYEKEDDTVEITVKYSKYEEIAASESGDPDHAFDVKVVLKKDPYSCFDGYNVVSLEKTETTESLEADNKTHYVYGDILDYDLTNNWIYLEYPYGDDYTAGNAYFDHFLTIDCSDNPGLIDEAKALQESGVWQIKVGFTFDGSVKVPFETIKGTSVDEADR
ncbi:hypothetical protein [Pseudobutyrivibrio sp.]|uniref:hypothetical protein n=1 Tax=Pseudobutyrivibrio sp. TaxID=2014367 RepID=UPI0025CC6E83|nr:hypothetical protein [Pseudobutyrivibrio sp.]MBR5649697.1 hypothetical protein [Pseudobutyrivibrio sp.]